ncbi:MAG TPA: hypothetical protein VIL30_02145 [Ramlibacter sp.]
MRAPAPSVAAPSAARAAAPAVSALPLLRWTHVRIERAGVPVLVPRDQAGLLPNLLDWALGRRAGPPANTVMPASLRLELMDDSAPAGVVELVGDEWRWTAEPGRPAVVLRVEPHIAAALREEAERLLRR